MKIYSIVGARPQFVKAAMIHKAMAKNQTEGYLLHTGQHYDSNMSQIFFDEMEIGAPHDNLEIGSGQHGQQTGKMLEFIEQKLLMEKPGCVIVYGDTNSTLAGALAAAKLHIPVVHIEAGLRSFNKKMPEEINRVLTDHISDLLFAPTEAAVKNLINEGIAQDNISNVGDIMYDASIYFSNKINKSGAFSSEQYTKSKYILVTIHRAENTNDIQRLKNIIDALFNLSKTYNIIFPLHPRTRLILEKNNMLLKMSSHFNIIDPVGYLEMLSLEKNSKLIVTDSGGLQKEAYFCQAPCVTLRDETEWVELVDLGVNKLISPNLSSEIISARITEFLDNFSFDFTKNFIYGKGNSASLIVQEIKEKLF